MAPSSIQVTPMMPKNTAPRTQVRMEAGPAMLAAARVARSQPDPTWTLTARAIRPKRLICCLRWASLASYAPSTGRASGVPDMLTVSLVGLRWCGCAVPWISVRAPLLRVVDAAGPDSLSEGGRADDVDPRAAQGLGRHGAAEVLGGPCAGAAARVRMAVLVDAPGADVTGFASVAGGCPRAASPPAGR